MVARELTKVHQEFIRGTVSEVIERLHDAKGEFTLVVGPATNARQNHHLLSSDDAVIREFCRLTESSATSRREAVRLVARGSGRSSKDVYSAIERAKKLV
jgi:16S rRNA (cytidine1402-2'-O)-methyltransferase